MLVVLYDRTSVMDYPNIPASIDLRRRIAPEGLKVLNIGVGPENPSWIAGQLPFLHFRQLDHLDIDRDLLDKAKRVKWAADEVNYIHQDVLTYERIDDYDLILIFDVIEHLTKEDAIKLLGAKPKKMVFFPIDPTGATERPDHEHLSRWTEQELKDLGFKTEVLPDFHFQGGKLIDAVWAWNE